MNIYKFLKRCNIYYILSTSIILSLIGVICSSYTPLKQKLLRQNTYKTEIAIILIVDGPRYTETWGDSSHRHIPHMAHEMSKEGVVFRNFYNDGYTYTTSGHAAICTGYRQELENHKGNQLPEKPSLFQYYLKDHPQDSSKVWVIATKDKLEILSDCEDARWKHKFRPSVDCGNSGLRSGYREDSITFQKVMHVLKNEKAKLMMVNFKEPDHSGHARSWKKYLKGIADTDSLVWEIWKYIQSDPYYKNKTSLFVTNDHGRHSDGIKDGFCSHGDECEGCRHINLYAFGPDFKKNGITDVYHTQVDLTATIAELLYLKMPYIQGKPIQELFR